MMNHLAIRSALILLAACVPAVAQTQPVDAPDATPLPVESVPAPTDAATATPAPAPADAPGDAQPLEAVITGVEGLVQVRENEEAPWQPAKVGMRVEQGAEFRTGPRSAVRLAIEPDQTVTLDRLGTVKLLEAVRQGNKVKTDLGMKYGRTRYEIEAAGVEHESRIASPNTTLAIRGTKVSMYDQPPFAPEAISLTGRVEYQNMRRQRVAFGGRGRRTAVGGESPSAAETALTQTFVDPGPARARTESEREILLVQSRNPGLVRNAVPAVSALLDFIATADFSNPIDAFTNRNREVPGALAFDLTWQGGADLDLGVVSPSGERLSAFPFSISSDGLVANASTNRVLSGGRIQFDDQGPNEPGAALNGGRETAFWEDSFPKGRYKVRVNYIEGDVAQNITPPASYTLTVYRNGEAVRTSTGTLDPSNPKNVIPVRVPKNP